jgi:hypothetical protein
MVHSNRDFRGIFADLDGDRRRGVGELDGVMTELEHEVAESFAIERSKTARAGGELEADFRVGSGKLANARSSASARRRSTGSSPTMSRASIASASIRTSRLSCTARSCVAAPSARRMPSV